MSNHSLRTLGGTSKPPDNPLVYSNVLAAKLQTPEPLMDEQQRHEADRLPTKAQATLWSDQELLLCQLLSQLLQLSVHMCEKRVKWICLPLGS